MNTRNTSCTTTGLQVNDSHANRIATQRTNEAAIAATGRVPEPASADLSPMGEQSQPTPIVVKPVDFKTITGSYAGDHRAPALATDITAFAKNSPNPRENVGQFPLGKNTPSGPAPITTVDSTEVGG